MKLEQVRASTTLSRSPRGRARACSIACGTARIYRVAAKFSPRIADVGGARFWRVDGKADYGMLDVLASSKINMKLIAQHWDDLLRLAGSLKLGVERAAGLTRTLKTNDRPTQLARALQELGRLDKRLYLLRFIDDERYRRRILIQLSRGEGRHQLARVILHGRRGSCAGATAKVQEDQLGARSDWWSICSCFGTRSTWTRR
jgi:TnpA family transposase